MPRRKLNVFGQPWEWKFDNPLLVWDPSGKLHKISLGAGVDRDIEKKNFSIRPRKIVDLIARNFLGYTDRGGFPAGFTVPEHFWFRREGFELLAGPRGKWQIKVTNWRTELISPEGIHYRPSTKDVMGQEWLDKMSEEVEKLYPRIVEELEGDVVKYRRDLAWQRLQDELSVKTNYQAARRYIRETFGEKVDG
jgi:hypothetical protein